MPPDPSREVSQDAVAQVEPGLAPTIKAADKAAVLGVLPAATPPPPDTPKLTARVPKPSGPPPQVGSTVKHYELLRKLGEGGMGAVFLARDTTLGRLVAVKVLQLHAGPSAERFLVEAQATARCRHDNIVVIHEVDELHGYPFMVLEYLEGRTLREWMARRDPAAGPVSPSLAVELMLPVVRALACAHQLGIVHRDLKPENIFLTDAGRVVVLDFGIAKRTDASTGSARDALKGLVPSGGLTQDGALLGTLPYMSPEQLRAEDIDARSDLWAVGILLYELATGGHPLAYRTAFELLDMAESEAPMPSVRDKRPDVGALGAIIDRCLQKPRASRHGSAAELVAALEALTRGGKPSELGDDEGLFLGLSAFQEADAERYVGRDHEVVALVGRLRSQPLVLVAGPSGTGKSSFVRAGVIPALKRSGEDWEAFILRPGRRPLAQLAALLAQLESARDTEALFDALPTQPGLVGALLRARCRSAGARHRILLFVDQFEELYTLGAEAAERAAFVACLEGAADDASSPLRVMLSLRSDFLYRMADEGHFTAEVTRGLFFLRAMARDGLRAALTRPLEAAGYRFENDAMIEAIVDGLERTKSPLPLLQFTAAKLWEARDRKGRLLTQESYDQIGGVAGALSAHANAVLAALSVAEQRLCRAVFLRLCTPERTRAVVSLPDLRGLAADGDAVEQVIHRLSDARLVLVEAGGEHEGTTVELCHESLIESWDKLTQWLTESEQDAQFLARLRAAAQQWDASHEAEGLLWRDRAAREAAEWLARWRAEHGAAGAPGLARREERFLVAVVALSERGRRRRQRIMAGVLATVSVIAVVVTLLAIGMQRQAERADLAADEAARETLATQIEARNVRNATRMVAARELEQKDPTLMLALLREVEPPGVPRGWAELASRALQSGIVREMRHWGEWVPVYGAAWSPDGQRVVAALDDATARVWKPGDPAAPIVLRGHETHLWSAAFSPDGTRIVTASGDKTARIWRADGSGAPIVLRGHEGPVVAATFSPDGAHIVTASEDRTARVWRADGTGQPLVLRAHEGEVNAAAFSPDGQRIVTASSDKTVRVWRADGTGQPLVLRAHEGGVEAAAFSPDGQRIVTASIDATARVWRADGTGQPLVLRGHEDVVKSAAFSPDGQRVVTGSKDATARVWKLDGSAPPLVLRGHTHWIYTAAWSPDGASILTASLDRTTRLFHVDIQNVPIVLRGHEAPVEDAAWSPDGQYVATVSKDKTARVWRADGAGPPVVLRGHEDRGFNVAWSPDGQRVATVSDDRTARVWRADGAGLPVILRGHEGPLWDVAWSPDGTHIVTTSSDRTARVWRADGAGLPVILRGHEAMVLPGSFSPDGQRIATGSHDRTVRVWNADGSGAPQIFRGSQWATMAIAWSPDGRRIVAGGGDKVVRVWSLDPPGDPVVLSGHEQAVYSVAWSPDGKRIVTASDDKTARIWSADGAGPPVILRGHEHKVVLATFGPDGARVLTASLDKTAQIWNADGSGEPYVLSGHQQGVASATWSPDGTRILVRVSEDANVWIWAVRAPLRGTDDPRLWTATPDCMSIERRIELLSISEARARADQETCERRVQAAAAASR
ncbi:MAG TPA: protein kinase [Kofleriaceae bacterium]|nr:protein kinase [Kofleriaceae bacterium]